MVGGSGRSRWGRGRGWWCRCGGNVRWLVRVGGRGCHGGYEGEEEVLGKMGCAECGGRMMDGIKKECRTRV